MPTRKNELSPDMMLSKVTSELDLVDFGDGSFVEDYAHAIEAINAEVELTPSGAENLKELVSRMLTNRLRMVRDIKANPDILGEVLAPVVVITGLPRTGTTKLQRLLSATPQFQALYLWKLLNPAPFTETLAIEPDPRIAWAEEAANYMEQNSPGLWASHPSPATDADEDFLLHDLTFIAPTLPMMVGARQLLHQLSPIDNRVYKFLKLSLQYLQWQDADPHRSKKPWVLKSPIHIGSIETLQGVFPGAKIICCHRDIEVSMTSIASVDELSRERFTDNLDRMKIGAGVVDYWSKAWSRNIEQRARLDGSSILDIGFKAINHNSETVVEDIFSFVGLDFSESARAAIQNWESSNKRHKHGLHVYSAADYGITSGQVKEAFKDYYNYFSSNLE